MRTCEFILSIPAPQNLFLHNKTGRASLESIRRTHWPHTKKPVQPSLLRKVRHKLARCSVSYGFKPLEAAYIMYRINSKARCVTKALSAAV